MIYPAEVQKNIDILETYENDDTLAEFDILHFYPRGLAYPNGYYDSQNFDLIGFNAETKKRRNLGRHDACLPDGISVKKFGVFADGSFIVLFYGFVTAYNTDMQIVRIKAT